MQLSITTVVFCNTFAYNDVSMILTAVGSVRITTVTEKPDLTKDNTAIVDTLNLKTEVVWTVTERAE